MKKEFISRLVFHVLITIIIGITFIGCAVSFTTEKEFAEAADLLTPIMGTPVPTDTSTPTPMVTPTNTCTPSPTNTCTPTPSPTNTCTPSPTPTNTPTPTPTVTPLPKIYDIALDAEMQWFLLDLCKDQGVDFELALATAWRESRYKSNAYNVNSNGSEDAGIFQINDCNWEKYERMFPGWDPYDPYDSCRAGVAHIKMCMQYDEKPTCFMMVYNMGHSGAKKLWKQGIWSSSYSRGLVDYMENTLPKLKLIDY